MFTAGKIQCISSCLSVFKIYFCLHLFFFFPCGISWSIFWIDFLVLFSITLFSFSSLLPRPMFIWKSEHDTDFNLHGSKMLHVAKWIIFIYVKSTLKFVNSIMITELVESVKQHCMHGSKTLHTQDLLLKILRSDQIMLVTTQKSRSQFCC